MKKLIKKIINRILGRGILVIRCPICSKEKEIPIPWSKLLKKECIINGECSYCGTDTKMRMSYYLNPIEKEIPEVQELLNYWYEHKSNESQISQGIDTTQNDQENLKF